MSSNAKQLYRKLSSHVHESFLEEGGDIANIAHGAVLTNSMRVLRTSSPRSSSSRQSSIRTDAKLDPNANDPVQRPIISFIVVYTMIFFNGCCFTAVVPSVPFYLQFLNAPETFLGWVVSFYSLGQIMGSPIGGFLTSKLSSKKILTISSMLGFLSSSLYSTAPTYMWILYSRLLTGISAGMEFTTELTFIARNTSKKERTVYLASVTAVNVLGFILGPSLGGLLSMLDVEIFGFEIDKYTGPGWLLALMFLIDIVIVQLFFGDFFTEDEDEEEDRDDDTMITEQGSLLNSDTSKEESYGGLDKFELGELSRDTDQSSSLHQLPMMDATHPPSLPMVLSLIFVQFTVMCGFSILETITSPLAQEYFDWDVLECNLLFTAGGAISLVAYVVFIGASKFVEDRLLVAYALTLCFIGFVLVIDWDLFEWCPHWISGMLPPYLDRFITGYMIMNAGFMTGRPVTFALYSKLIGSENQGEYLGWMVAGGSAARTLGPFVAVTFYYSIEIPGMNLLALFGTVGAVHIGCLVLVAWQWAELLPSNLFISIR